MIIRTKNLRGLSKYQIDRFFKVVLIQHDKRDIFFDCWILLNGIFKYHEIVPNFYISEYSLQPKKI
ncbi:hypothetical protein EDF66_12819 [Sphingobacterium sp. JUb20]|nr:hypothetical protein [Sphingobacterium sp. JUb21]TCQ95431.1 hypothetical protein EDF66_12819 [Sphingobacterium sp. JUb20]